MPIVARLLLLAASVSEISLTYLGLSGHLSDQPVPVELWCLIPFVVGVAALRLAALPDKAVLMFTIGIGIGLQCVAIGHHPSSSDDVNRYVWDAKVQLHGIDPYRYPPDSAELKPLRQAPLFYPAANCPRRIADGLCSELNRPSVPTIYPPVAEGAFVLARLSSGSHTDSPLPLQVLAASTALAVAVLLALSGLRDGRPAWTVALWAWCPVTVFELGSNAHIDGLAVLLSLGALIAARSQRAGWAGALLGAAIATKLYPALLLGVLLSHRAGRVLTAAGAVVVAVYLPHVLAVGPHVLGYLPGYLKEENYTTGGRYNLLAVIAPRSVLPALAVLVLVATAVLLGRVVDANRPQDSAVCLMGVTLLVSTPAYSWYALLLLALVAMSGRLEWLALAIAPTVATLGAAHFAYPALFRTICFAVGLVAAVLGTGLRRSRISGPAPHRERSLESAA